MHKDELFYPVNNDGLLYGIELWLSLSDQDRTLVKQTVGVGATFTSGMTTTSGVRLSPAQTRSLRQSMVAGTSES